MGIRFRCHHCEHELHVKDFQGGKRGRCPVCQGKFRIPLRDAEHSLESDASGEVERSQPVKVTAPSQPHSPVSTPSAESTAAARISAQNASAQTVDSKSSASSDFDSRSAALPATEVVAAAAPPAAATSSGQPKALSDAPQAAWFVRPPSGGQYGPAPSDAIWQWLQENRISRDSLVWCEGWPEWLAASQVFADFFVVNQLEPATNANASNLAAAAAEPSETTVANSASANLSGPQPAVLGDRNWATRKQRRKRNYAVLIAILSIVMIVLLITLAIVLNNQQAAV